MNKYNGLLSEVACQYEILRGSNETEIEYKTRLVYSICGLMAYASLWDDSEELVSITHLKRKIRDVLINYKGIYPELFSSLPFKSEELEDEITDIFLNTGIVYHCPNRIISSAKREEPFGTLLFQRGIAIDNIKCVSGIGFYTKQEDKEASPDKVKEMFGLEQMDLLTLWGTTLDTTTWETNPTIGQSMEYLRLKPPFSRGYWVDKPDTSGCVSIPKEEMAKVTNLGKKAGSLADMLVGADVFIGVSAPGAVTTEMVKTMAKDAVIFACANPTPEIFPDDAKDGGARVIATGRSDFPNQINNVLAFPGVFRGAFDVRAKDINDEMKIAAAKALAGLITDEELSADYIIPKAFDKRVGPAVARAVADAARETGVARL